MSVFIPFESQLDPQIQRGCGAACLSMVYKSFGKDVPQASVWPLIAKQNRFGSVASTTHLMAAHALSQGLSALAIQARHPIQVLRICREKGVRAILNHRPRLDAVTGHYTVLVDIDDKTVVIHDPASGPSRRMSHAELLQLWQPASANSEIAGNVLIGIAADAPPIPACEFCHTPIPAKIDCPKCGKAVSLSPAALLSCIRDGCIARMWNYVACPTCDFMWSFNEAGTSTADAPRPEQKAGFVLPTPPDLDQLFAEVDRFCAYLLSIPGAAEHADLNAQLNILKGGKERLRQAIQSELAGYQSRLDQSLEVRRRVEERAAEQRQKLEEINKPLPPLDGNALGQALLKNLGFH
ncbi:MAG TPA: cysteine peptidase family C39 domain-containing protein [Bryobacteraceae bacterium]|nr:cysteine peptidase family C39 domain-containing protein [Bryobacteraceae bacterium]